MNTELIEGIANAVLYEGYMLYPYRPSATKNRRRWNFGVVYPKWFSDSQNGTDAGVMQTECLVCGVEAAAVEVKVRFLQLVTREIGKPRVPPGTRDDNAEPSYEVVESLAVGNQVLYAFEETTEREITLRPMRLADLVEAGVRSDIAFPCAHEIDFVKGEAGAVEAILVRRREALSGAVEIRAAHCADNLFRLTIVVSNFSSVDMLHPLTREVALRMSFLSTHTVLGVSGAEFVSLLDPPSEVREIAAECKNIGTWPVLAGDQGARGMMLSSPIILYDYPQIAPESPGNLFDGTEIDEILSLRIMTLTDDEKREIRQTDDRAKEILERTETLPPEHLWKLHGALRGLKHADTRRNEQEEGDKQ